MEGSTGVTTGGFAGFSSDQIFWGVLLIVAIIIGLMLLSSLSGGSRYHGTKGGRVKRVTEYEDTDDIDEDLDRDRI